MPRRKAAEVEILPPEDDQPSRGRKKLVEAEHTIKYSAPVPVTIEEAPEDTDLDLINDDVIEEKPRRRTSKNERDELRKKLAQSGATPGSQLKLTIERYLHSDVVDGSGGVFAETEHCNKYVCSESHITGEDYIDVARRFGPGLYRFTLRMQNKIVTAWDKRISATPSGPVIQSINPADPTSPQVIIQTTGDGQQQVQPMSMRDIMKAQKEVFKEQLEMAKLMREAYGLAPDQSANQPRSEEEILSSAILKQPEVIENVVGSVIKRFGGASGKDDEPWYADVVRDAVKSGQLVQVVQVAIDRIFNGVSGLFPGRQDNGQAQMEQAPLAQNAGFENPPQHHPSPDQFRESLPAQGQSQGSQSIVETGSHATAGQQQQIAPEEYALQLLIDHCRKQIPAKIACDRLIAYADTINDQAPHLSIDEYISMFAGISVESALEFVKTQPNGEAVASLPHAKSWTEELQRLIKEAGQEGEE